MDADDDHGNCYGFNLVYSGNHMEKISVGSNATTRVSSGINPLGFSWKLDGGDIFEAPEAVMTYSADGLRGLSLNMHSFINRHIIRSNWQKKKRPILINSWEASYFDVEERKLLSLARKAKDLGIELFVLDDGWFGKRNGDDTSLGDWNVNKEKFPNGLSGFSKKINDLGMDFGIWVEPEMVNVKSRLYEKHPDWMMDIPGRDHSEGRNQRILDLCNEEVVSFITEKMSKVFGMAGISYVKWDMNRIFSDVFSKTLPPDRQGEVFHRYIMGLYKILGDLTQRFPDILFEGCASGGNRFDLGVLSYFPQIWASDDTDALERMDIQKGYSYGYPQSVLGNHVSSVPNHQTLRITPLGTRFNISSIGILGYEMDLNDLSAGDADDIKEQIKIYKKYREIFQFGTLYRGKAKDQFTVVSEDKNSAVTVVFNRLAHLDEKELTLYVEGLDDDKKYHFYNIKKEHDIMEFGSLINTRSPVHIKQGSLVHKAISKVVKLPGETEDFYAYGCALKNAGVRVCPAYCGTGFDENVRIYPDFASRMYFIEKE